MVMETAVSTNELFCLLDGRWSGRCPLKQAFTPPHQSANHF